MNRTLSFAIGASLVALVITACDSATSNTSSNSAATDNPSVGITTHSVVVSGSGVAPSTAPAGNKPRNLAHGAQQGFVNCTVDYKDAQHGAGTSTFTAYVLGDKGAAYPTGDSANYSVMLQLTVTDTSGKTHAVSENFGSGSRTAADNPGGGDWFTTTQGDVEVSADNAHGVVASTVPVPLGQVQSVTGNIVVMGNNDNSVTTKDCAVRPG